MQQAFLVFLGGGLGSVLRWLSGLGAARLFGTGFPYGTLFVNLLGGLVIGLLARVLVTLPNEGVHARLWLGEGINPRLLLITGVLGGFTTFSAFSLDAASLWISERPGTAVLYVLASVAGSLFMCGVGLWLGTLLTR